MFETFEIPGMPDSSIYLVVAILVAVLHRATVAVYNRYFHPLSGIPGPFVASWSRLWLVYQTARCKRHRLDPTLHTKFGPCVRIAPNELLINDIHQFQTIYGAGTKFNKSTWYGCMKPGQDNFNLLAETHMGRYWQQRRLVSPAFTTQALQRHQDLLARALGKFITKMETRKTKPLDLVRWMNFLALDVLTEMTFSCNAGYIMAEDDRGNCVDIDNFWQHLSWIGLLPTFCRWYQNVQRFLESVGLPLLYKADTGGLHIIQFYIRQISARSIENGVYCDIAGRMQELRAQKPELRKEWADIMLLHVVGAGFDTLGTTLASCLYFISQTHGCQDRLAEEISSATLEGESQHEDLMRLLYLQACIKETLRLKPVVATSLSRTVPVHGLWIGSRLIPGETIVGMNPVVLHRSQEIFGRDAERFRPERWLEASKEQRAKMELYSLAFGSPARSCPGKNLAWMILCRTIAEVVQHLSFRTLEPDEIMRKGLPAYKEASFFVFKPYNIWAEFGRREDTS